MLKRKIVLWSIMIVLLCGCGRDIALDKGNEDNLIAEQGGIDNSDNDGMGQEDVNESEENSDKPVIIDGDVEGNGGKGDLNEETSNNGTDNSLEETMVDTDDSIPEEETLSIIMVGDILLHTPVEEAARDEDGGYDFDFIFSEMKDEIGAADIAIVNQEVIIGGKELGVSGYPAFNAPTEIGDALVKAGFDVVCHGTNHALDKGKKGVVNTINYWKTEHPEMIIEGINEDEDEYRAVTVVEKKGMRIAILNYTYGTNGISAPSDMPHAVDMLNEDKIRTDLTYAEENADFTIVCPHWGTEYRLEADSSQKRWNELFRECGADLILGTHPHVIEPIDFALDENEGISNNHGGGDMLTYYSLGNFVNWTSGTGKGTANRMVGGMAEVTLTQTTPPENPETTKEKASSVNTASTTNNNASNTSVSETTNNTTTSDGKAATIKNTNVPTEVVIKDYNIRALVCHLTSAPKGITVYPLADYSESLGEQNEIRKQDSSFSTQYCTDLCNKVWGENNWH